jgi:hypothetical protein
VLQTHRDMIQCESMLRKVERLAATITEAVSAWDRVECVSSGEYSEVDILDPYFALVMDVYSRGVVPPPEGRKAAFAEKAGDPGDFESSAAQFKDRFFIEGLPVRVEYKDAGVVDELISGARGLDAKIMWGLKNSGTYVFHRLRSSRVLFKRSDWIDSVRKEIRDLPSLFWRAMRDSYQLKMEHLLADLGAAAQRDDDYFYDISSAAFIRYAAASLFMVNKIFEPSHRSVTALLPSLKKLPADFSGRWDSLVRYDPGIRKEQRFEVAQLIARSIIAL